MHQSITTRYIAPSNVLGSRIKAVARKRDAIGKEMSVTRSYTYDNVEEEHCRAAKQCAEKYEWTGLWVGGGNVDETGYVFVNVCTVADAAVRSNMLGKEDADWFWIEPRR